MGSDVAEARAAGGALDALALAAETRAGRRRPLDVVASALQSAREHSDLGAFWSLGDERALERALALEQSPELPLAGVPLAVKDGFDVTGLPTTIGLRAPPRHADTDATAVHRLEAAGAVAIGKTAMDSLAWTTHGQAEGFPPCLNPLDRDLSPGGSSAGSAVAVAAGIVPLALGSDTAGSIRIPAAYCGVVGLKPGFGTVSLEGCRPLSPSFDTVGILARSVRDCMAAYRVLVSDPGPPSRPENDRPVAVLSDLFEASDPDVKRTCAAALARLEALGMRLEEVELGWSAPGLGLIFAYELAAAWGAEADAHPERFPEPIRAAIARARTLPRSRCERVREELQSAGRVLEQKLGGFSALLSPTVPVPVPSLEEEDVSVSTRFTRVFSALGWPALSVPCGRDSAGRPVGMHVASVHSVEDAGAVAACCH